VSVSGGGIQRSPLHKPRVLPPPLNPAKASSYNILHYVCMSLSSTWIPYTLYIYIFIWMRRERVGGMDLHPLISIFFFFFFVSVFSLCYVNSEQAMFYLLIAFPSRRQGRKLSQPAFALTCISPQIHTHTPFHSIHTGYGEAIGQVNVKRKVSFFFLGGFCFQNFIPPPSIWTCFGARQTRLVSLLVAFFIFIIQLHRTSIWGCEEEEGREYDI
jgi:hypothetical protein